MWLGDARHRDRRRDADEDQQRRHQEAAADAEHAGDESDREPHRQDEEDVDRQVGDREVDLHARQIRRFEAPHKFRGERHHRRRSAGEADRVSTGFAARHPTWRLTKSRQEAAAPTRARSWHRASPARRPANGSRLGTQRVGDGILPVLAAQARLAALFYCAGRGMDKSSLGPTTGGLRLAGAVASAAAVSQPPAGVLTCDRRLRLRLGRPGLHRGLRRRQRLLVEPGADVVALLGGFPVALAGREREPLVGFGQVLLDADAAGIEDRRDCTGCRRRRSRRPCGTTAPRSGSRACRRCPRRRARRDCACALALPASPAAR